MRTTCTNCSNKVIHFNRDFYGAFNTLQSVFNVRFNSHLSRMQRLTLNAKAPKHVSSTGKTSANYWCTHLRGYALKCTYVRASRDVSAVIRC